MSENSSENPEQHWVNNDGGKTFDPMTLEEYISKGKLHKLSQVVVILGDQNKQDIIKPKGVFDEDDIDTINRLKKSLRELKGYHFIYLDNHDTLIPDLMNIKEKIDFVLNLCDEGYNNDPKKELHIPTLLEILNIPYTGAGPQCLAYCYDKSLVKSLAKGLDIPVPETIFIKTNDVAFNLPSAFPVLVKPNFADASFGITQRSVANNSEELTGSISGIRETGYDKAIIVEEFLPGKDISVGIIGNPPGPYTLLPITEEDYSILPQNLPEICGYEAKWLPDSPYWNKIKSIPVNLPENTKNTIISYSLKLFERLECRDYTRFDWRLDSNGNPKLLEVNPNPGWCWDGHLAKMSNFFGLSYTGMLNSILQAAEQRLKINDKEEAIIDSL